MNQVANASTIEIDPSGFTTKQIRDRTPLGCSGYRDAHAGTNIADRQSKLVLV